MNNTDKKRFDYRPGRNHRRSDYQYRRFVDSLRYTPPDPRDVREGPRSYVDSLRFSPPASRDAREGSYRTRNYYKPKRLHRPPRSNSPVIGSEEYMTQKIQKTSAIIMRHLLTPEESIVPINNSNSTLETDIPTANGVPERENETNKKNAGTSGESISKKPPTLNVCQIHDRIMNHINNLNNGRKKNLISTRSSSAYDKAIDHVVKQKRLEISRALRNVCNKTTDGNESTDWINSIIPDIGVKIEQLPREVLEQLQATFSDPEDLPLAQCNSSEVIDEGVKEEVEDIEIIEQVLIENRLLRRESIQAFDTPDKVEETIVEQIDESIVNVEDDEDMVVVEPDEVETIDLVDDDNRKKKKKNKKGIPIEALLKSHFPYPPRNIKICIERMKIIDGFIEELNQFRQNMFDSWLTRKKPKRKRKKAQARTTGAEETTEESSTTNQPGFIDFQLSNEKVLVLKICDDKLVAGTESGKVYFFDVSDGTVSNALQATTVPITCLHYAKPDDEQGKPYMFLGSYEFNLKVFNFYSNSLLQDVSIDDSIQCMDENWGYLFLGCMRGTLLRYSIKKNSVEYEDRFDTNPIFVLKATQEGARRVLLIGSRNSSVFIRDAMSGLHLRTMETIMCPTVYCIIMDQHFVYCGTTSYDILVYNFNNGKLVKTYKASQTKGISCMKVVGRFLFASCYSGEVYVYNLRTKTLAGTLTGPGGVIISMEVFKNQVIVGTMSFKFSSILIPEHIYSQMLK